MNTKLMKAINAAKQLREDLDDTHECRLRRYAVEDLLDYVPLDKWKFGWVHLDFGGVAVAFGEPNEGGFYFDTPEEAIADVKEKFGPEQAEELRKQFVLVNIL